MMSSTMPLAERLDWHPVHRATAVLRRALLNSAAISPDAPELWDERVMRPAQAFTGLAHGPVSITYPTSLAEALGLPSTDEHDQDICQPSVACEPDGSGPAEDASDGFVMLDGAAQAQLMGLVEAFNRRQRQASLLVAISIAIAFTLTLGGLLLMFSVTDPKPALHEEVAPKDAASIARRAEIAPPFSDRIRVRANRSAKTAPLLIRARADTEPPAVGGAASGARVIRAATGRPLTLAPLLPLGSARYLLLRGLPEEATLSAGRRTGTGAWMVKDEDVPGLTLILGGNASGDYPVDVYLLEANDGPQARRSFVLRVEPTPRLYTAGLSLDWSPPLPEAKAAAPEATETVPKAVSTIEPHALLERARTLLAEGDIAGARLILMHLAERGDGDAAYSLARTYDPDALAELGSHDVASDAAMARAWYERAANAGHAGAAQRLKAIAGG